MSPLDGGQAVRVEPDLDFILRVARQGGDFYKKCIQCGTCAATCPLSPDRAPFPRKEMAWAVWGMKDRLMQDPDIWLCYQCNDCSMRCPRGARPGEVMGAIRQECVRHYAFPRFIGRWVNEGAYVPLLFAISASLLVLALFLRDPIARALGLVPALGGRIVFSYSAMFPHWLLISFFGFFSILSLVILLSGTRRFWKMMRTGDVWGEGSTTTQGFFPSFVTTLKNILIHDNFAECDRSSPRFWAHTSVFFGFLGLSLVAVWIITNRINPLLNQDFVYPFSFWSPWKMLANVGGIAVLLGVLLMVKNRFTNNEHTGAGRYFDWALISALLLVVLTGFATEALHYVRLEPHRHLIYFVHLTAALTLILTLPYSKLAHIAYRTAALTYGEMTGRNSQVPHKAASAAQKLQQVEDAHVLQEAGD